MRHGSRRRTTGLGGEQRGPPERMETLSERGKKSANGVCMEAERAEINML